MISRQLSSLLFILVLFFNSCCESFHILSPLVFLGNRLKSRLTYISPHVSLPIIDITSNINLPEFALARHFQGIFGLNVEQDSQDRPSFAARLLAWFLKSLIEPRTKFVSGLVVKVFSSSNRDILRGKVGSLEIKFDSIAYSMIQITGGGSLMLQGVELKMRRLLFQDLHFLRKPYQIVADFVFTQNDIVNSKIIRDWIQLLVDTIISQVLSDPAGLVLKVAIKRVTIRSRRIYVHGEADIASTGTTVPFEISTGAGVRGNGQVVFLRDIQVVLNPDSFLRTSVPLLLSTPIDVDIGDDCYVDDLILAGKHITVKARTVVYPVPPFAVTPVVRRALYRYDLAALLSSLLRVKGGFLRVRTRFNINFLRLNPFRKRNDDSIETELEEGNCMNVLAGSLLRKSE
eukprot:gene10927-22810_t